MKVKFKKLHPDAVTPSYAKAGDAGLDMTAVAINTTDNYVEYKTGIAIEIPEGFVGFLCPRSSVTNKSLIVKNSIGIIDSGYRGEISVRFYDTKENPISKTQYYATGERVAQLIIVPIPTIELEECEELSQSERGKNGYGSTDRPYTSSPN